MQANTVQTNAVQASTITLLDVSQTKRLLGIDDERLLDLINQGILAAYDLGGHLRFRQRDVGCVASRLAIAA